MERARVQIVQVCRRLYERGLIAGMEGNVSVRLESGTLLVTPAGMAKGELEPGDLVEVSLRGQRVSGYREPSSEVRLHTALYGWRPDVGAVVHAHPPVATGFAVAGEGLDAGVLPELICELGDVPVVPYATPGTAGVGAALEPFVDRHHAFLLANHGAVTVGPSLEVAHRRMESLEQGARILLAARLVGRVRRLSADQLAELAPARTASAAPRGARGSSARKRQRRGE